MMLISNINLIFYLHPFSISSLRTSIIPVPKSKSSCCKHLCCTNCYEIFAPYFVIPPLFSVLKKKIEKKKEDMGCFYVLGNLSECLPQSNELESIYSYLKSFSSPFYLPQFNLNLGSRLSKCALHPPPFIPHVLSLLTIRVVRSHGQAKCPTLTCCAYVGGEGCSFTLFEWDY